PQHTPGAMIEAPLVTVQPYPVRLGYFHNPLGQLRQTRRRVIESKQLRGKAIEIVYGSWLRHGSYGGSTKEPVCRNYQQRLRSRQFPAHLPPGLGKAISLQCIHRAAMADEKCRHPVIHTISLTAMKSQGLAVPWLGKVAPERA